MSYQAIPFSGEWNEDPENLLGWFLQCMGTADDERKARHFVYYLRAGSDADEWFEDLPEEEKESWVTIEQLFRRKWLKEEISIKESVTSQNLLVRAVMQGTRHIRVLFCDRFTQFLHFHLQQ